MPPHHPPAHPHASDSAASPPALLPVRRELILVTGIQAAGKSTVSRLLAQRFLRGAHVEADTLQHMIVSGSEGVREPGWPTGEAERQYRLRLAHMCLLGRSFLDAGFTPVLDDIIAGDSWPYVQSLLQGLPHALFVLAPSVAVVVQQRDLSRDKLPLGEAWAEYLDGVFRATMRDAGHWLDSSDQTPAQTVDQIVAWLLAHPRC